MLRLGYRRRHCVRRARHYSSQQIHEVSGPSSARSTGSDPQQIAVRHAAVVLRPCTRPLGRCRVRWRKITIHSIDIESTFTPSSRTKSHEKKTATCICRLYVLRYGDKNLANLIACLKINILKKYLTFLADRRSLSGPRKISDIVFLHGSPILNSLSTTQRIILFAKVLPGHCGSGISEGAIVRLSRRTDVRHTGRDA